MIWLSAYAVAGVLLYTAVIGIAAAGDKEVGEAAKHPNHRQRVRVFTGAFIWAAAWPIYLAWTLGKIIGALISDEGRQ